MSTSSPIQSSKLVREKTAAKRLVKFLGVATGSGIIIAAVIYCQLPKTEVRFVRSYRTSGHRNFCEAQRCSTRSLRRNRSDGSPGFIWGTVGAIRRGTSYQAGLFTRRFRPATINSANPATGSNASFTTRAARRVGLIEFVGKAEPTSQRLDAQLGARRMGHPIFFFFLQVLARDARRSRMALSSFPSLCRIATLLARHKTGFRLAL